MLRIKAERLLRDWSQQDLAHRARMAAADISRIETGRLRPYPGQAKRLARTLKLHASELLQSVDIAVQVKGDIPGRQPCQRRFR